jgi:drug/metabolite transporter (DMT)-like permease
MMNTPQMAVKSPRAAWLAPALVFVLFSGFLGVTTKLALKDLSWQEVLVWTAAVYAVIAAGMVLGAGVRVRWGTAAGWGAVSGALAALALVLLFVALEVGEVGQVVPITASYPVITLLLAAAVLGERVTRGRVGATFLVIAGVILLSLD